jgi:hypothetical protein
VRFVMDKLALEQVFSDKDKSSTSIYLLVKQTPASKDVHNNSYSSPSEIFSVDGTSLNAHEVSLSSYQH